MGQTSKNFSVLIENNPLPEGNETANLVLSNPVGSGLNSPGRSVLTIVDNSTTVPTTNALDDSRFFVTQQYLDFLNRQPDASGVNFWTNNIESCGNASCREAQRINTSAAFFLSTEFQQTGYLVERIYKVAYGDASGASTFNGSHQLAIPIIRFNEFLPDTGDRPGCGGGPERLGDGFGEQQANLHNGVCAALALHFGIRDIADADTVCESVILECGSDAFDD